MILINNDVLAWNLHKKVWPIEIKLLILHKNYTRKNVMDELKWNNKDVMNHYDSNSRHRFNYASSLAPILAARGHENAHNGEKHLFWCAASHPCRWCNDDAVTGNEYGLFSKLVKDGNYKRFMITYKHVQFLRGKTCIGIWCYANKFAEKYRIHGLFSGMIISGLQEAIDLGVPATKEEIDTEMEKFTMCLKDCMETYWLKQTPQRMKELDNVQSALTKFNYCNLYYYE